MACAPTPPPILLATIGAAHGLRGETRVKAFGADPAALASYGPLFASDGRAFEIERLRPSTNMLIVKFRGIDDRNAAEALNGTSLYVPRERLPPPGEDEFYHADLIGLAVVTETGEPLGTVVAIHDFGAGDILDVAPARGPSLLVPFIKAAVPSIDIAAGRLTVVPPAETEVQDMPPEEREG